MARFYASTHDYDGIEGSTCHKPKCNYTTETACSNNGSKTCCKSLVNNECWHECDICRFNNIYNDFYPYAESSALLACKIIGDGNVDEAPYILSDSHSARNYKVSGFADLEPNGGWNADVWYCDMSEVKSLIGSCVSGLRSTRIVKGYKQATASGGIDYDCMDGRKVALPTGSNDSPYNNFIKTYGCPLSAIKCNASASNKYDKYYNTSSKCETAMGNGNPCAVVKNYRGYADTECWHGSRRCSDFGHDDFIFGNYNALSCPTNSGTTKDYYKNSSTGETVTIEKRECGYCKCIDGKYRFSLCNSMVYETARNYYQAKTKCEQRGYNKTVVEEGKSACSACPYSAVYWKCDN